MKNHTILLLMAAAVFFSRCEAGSKERAASTSKKFTAGFGVADYNLQNPSDTWQMPDELFEISGNAFIDDNQLLVIEDQRPLLYIVQLGDKAAVPQKIRFLQEDKKVDLEDVALQGATAFALRSDGTIYKIEAWRTKPAVTVWETGLDKRANAEGLCFDPRSNKLLVACKESTGGKAGDMSARAIYSLDPATGKLDQTLFLTIEQRDFEQVAAGKFDFHPSAVAVHPLTGDVFVLSTKGTKGLAHYGRDGKLKSFQWIEEALMPQPEGLCFSPAGALYISTEGKSGVPAKILRFDAVK